MHPIQNTSFSAFIPPTTSWKETLLISAVALAALSSIAQLFIGTFTSVVVYGFLATTAYLGYLAQKNVIESQRREEYLLDLQKNTQGLRKERLSFQEENKTLFQTNQHLKEQVNSLSHKLHSMEELLAKVDASALLTKELLTSCIDVSKGQKKTEENVQSLLKKLEKGTFVETQKEVERHVKQLEESILSIEKQIKQFFLHDAHASRLLEVKQEFAATSLDLQRIKKELSETSARLEKTSFELESKITRLKDQETSLAHIKNLTPTLLKLLKKPEIHMHLSSKEEEYLSTLQKNWQRLTC